MREQYFKEETVHSQDIANFRHAGIEMPNMDVRAARETHGMSFATMSLDAAEALAPVVE